MKVLRQSQESPCIDNYGQKFPSIIGNVALVVHNSEEQEHLWFLQSLMIGFYNPDSLSMTQ